MKIIIKASFGKTTACIALSLLSIFFLNGCSDDEKPEPEAPKELPAVTTLSVAEITKSSAKTGGNVTGDGGAAVTARGVVWSTSSNPTLADSKTTDGIGTGEFVAELNALESGTRYYVRAYATNSEGTTYGDEVSFVTVMNCDVVTDIDGNVYQTVTIGTSCWMAENLRTTRYNDGTEIPNVTDKTEWVMLTTGAYSVQSPEYEEIYGKLYNWYAVNTNKLCPEGWSIPSYHQWITMINTHLKGNLNNAGGKMKSTGNKTDGTGLWYAPNAGATNESGFTGLPGGSRSITGNFENIGLYGHWWSSSANPESGPQYAWGFHITYKDGNAHWGGNKISGFSCRCIKE